MRGANYNIDHMLSEVNEIPKLHSQWYRMSLDRVSEPLDIVA